MKLLIPNAGGQKNIPLLLRNAGYKQEVNGRTKEISYVRRAGGGDFPRFHVYVAPQGDAWVINLHLDQRAPSYSGTSAHAGEYDGDVVEREMERIKESVIL
ncbi:MAG: hypothetical protein AAB407_00295 [Patescibacteria group bacterium]